MLLLWILQIRDSHGFPAAPWPYIEVGSGICFLNTTGGFGESNFHKLQLFKALEHVFHISFSYRPQVTLFACHSLLIDCSGLQSTS
jgi:hypothetical protein